MRCNCRCSWCKLYHFMNRTLASGSRHQLRRLVSKLFNDLMHLQLDHDVDRAILDGTWPNAVQILERSLVKAKAFDATEEARELTNG